MIIKLFFVTGIGLNWFNGLCSLLCFSLVCVLIVSLYYVVLQVIWFMRSSWIFVIAHFQDDRNKSVGYAVSQVSLHH